MKKYTYAVIPVDGDLKVFEAPEMPVEELNDVHVKTAMRIDDDGSVVLLLDDGCHVAFISVLDGCEWKVGEFKVADLKGGE